ncbi:hypothetical protein [Bdellovibrio sp. NC01]|uniref:hypothetical protein n=1 Tax=Bdellovibrio sp. NC01 TaxID=2220073 RepID=UPI0011591980|nr:hypothetical protein [Bdellovibrio sp. NC01]QDK37298.1 hypothetical protein DOE51_06695 [Bdellovibrio sp. NC01]
MNQRINTVFLLPLVLTLSMMSFTGCATLSPRSIADVPAINVEKVKMPVLKNIPGNQLNLNVMDNRDSMYRQNTEALQKELRRVITQSLKSKGITVNPSSKNSLLISVQEQKVGDYKDGCVKINGMLAIPDVANVYSDATSCFEMKSPVSTVSMGSDINESYEMALSAVFQSFGTNLQKLNPKK